MTITPQARLTDDQLTAPDTADLPPWHVQVEGCVNVRDAGGWPLAQGGRMRLGRLYRSDDPVRATTRGRAAVGRLGLAGVVDLRQHAQFLRRPGFLPEDRTDHVQLVDRVVDPENPPTIADAAHLADLYEGMFLASRGQVAVALDAVGRRIADGPVLVHCSFGKDRAGMVTALVHAAIGVDAASIAEDYARSGEPSRRRRAWVLAEPLWDDPYTAHLPPFLFAAPAEAMAHFLDRMVERYGSLGEWVGGLDLAPDTLARLRDALIDPDGDHD